MNFRLVTFKLVGRAQAFRAKRKWWRKTFDENGGYLLDSKGNYALQKGGFIVRKFEDEDLVIEFPNLYRRN